MRATRPIVAAQPLESRVLLATFPIPSLSINFETPTLSPGATTSVSASGWTAIPTSGVSTPQEWYPTSSSIDFTSVAPLAAPANGNQLASIPQPGAAFERFVSAIRPTTTYTATVAIGRSLSQPLGHWALQLWAGGSTGNTLLASVDRDSSGAVNPATGAWADNTLTFDTGANPAAVGQNLFLRLTNASGGTIGPAYFDNVRFTSAPTTDLTLSASSSQVVLANRSQRLVFIKNGSGQYVMTTFTKSGGIWSPLFDSGSPLVQGPEFGGLPTGYQVLDNSTSHIAVKLTGTNTSPAYNWDVTIEANSGSDLFHFTYTAHLNSPLSITALDPQPAFWMNRSSAGLTIGQGPGNIYYGYPESQWGNSFPAGYLWSAGQEAAVFFNMTPSTWMGPSNLNRFLDVRANAWSQGSQTGLGLQVVHRTGTQIPAGSMTYDYYLYAKANPTQPDKTQAIDTMVKQFGAVQTGTANWATNYLDPGHADWTTVANGLSSNLMLQGVTYADWNLVPQVGSTSFESPALGNDQTSPLSNYGWTMLSSYGSAVPSAWHPYRTSTDFASVDPLAAPAAGSQVAFIQEPGGGTETALGSILANTRYTVTVAIGNRYAEGEGDWSIQLWAGGSGGTTFLNQTYRDQTGVSHPAPGYWADNNVTFSSAAMPSVVGQNLFVRITNYSGSHPGTIFFDNVRVTGALGAPAGAGWQDGPMFPENQVNVVRVSSDYAGRSDMLSSWDFSTVNNYLAPWIAYDQLNPDASRHAFIQTKVSDLPLFYDPNAGLIRWGTRSPYHIGDLEMSWQNFTFSLETVTSYDTLAPADFNPAVAGKFLMGLQGLMTLAHNVNYVFPQWFNPYSKVAIVQQDVPSLGIIYEPWQAGTYAWLMLKGYDITGDATYLNEARTAVDKLLGGTMTFTVSNSRYNITYSNPADFPITEVFGNGWGVAAAQRLYSLTGDPKYQTYSDEFFDSVTRESYGYESNLSYDAADQALQNQGMVRNHGGSFTGSPWENAEVTLPMTLRLKYDATPSSLMLKFLNLQRINGMYFFPPMMPPAAQPPASVANSPATYVPIEDFHTPEQGNVNGSMGRAIYMSNMGFWYYLMFDAFAGSSDRDVMIANLDVVDGIQPALSSDQRNFVVYNPTANLKTITLTMKSLAAGNYDLTTENAAGAKSMGSYTASQLSAGLSLTLQPGAYVRLKLVNRAPGVDANVQGSREARDSISYAYALMQEAATSGGVTPQLLQLKNTFTSALNSYFATDYATATAAAQQIVTALSGTSSTSAAAAVAQSSVSMTSATTTASNDLQSSTVKPHRGHRGVPPLFSLLRIPNADEGSVPSFASTPITQTLFFSGKAGASVASQVLQSDPQPVWRLISP